MKEYFICRKNYKGALNSALLAKSLHQKLWDDSPYLLKQLPGIGMVTAKVPFTSFNELFDDICYLFADYTNSKFSFTNTISAVLRHCIPWE